jgi:hypothetical protein
MLLDVKDSKIIIRKNIHSEQLKYITNFFNVSRKNATQILSIQ